MWTFGSDTDPGYWVAVESPTNVSLRDLTATANGPVAVGDEGVALGRGSDRWGVILEDGPGARSRALYAADATGDGERVYFAGAGGAFGYYDLRTERRRDCSRPQGNANTFYSLAVAGNRGEEKFLVGDGSGHVVTGHVRDDSETELTVDRETAPNAGNAVAALTNDADGYGYAVDVNSNVFVTTANDGWTRVGVDDAQGSFYDCAFADSVFVTGGGNGMVFDAADLTDHDGDATWTPTELDGFAVYGLDAGYGGQLACGEGGNVYVRRTGGEWVKGAYDATETFRAGLVDEQMVVVGANGLIVERRAPDELSAEAKARYDVGTENAADRPTGGSQVSTERTEWVDPDAAGQSADGDGVAPGESGSDPADPSDESDGGSGNDEADPSDEPDGSSGNDEADPNTDSDADSPD